MAFVELGSSTACLQHAYPAAPPLGQTFDTELVLRIGHLLGDEAKAKGANVILGPTINIQRDP